MLIDGKPARSCLTLAALCEGQSITTIEGVSASGELDLVQKSMLECGAVQCGFCTPGIVITAKALLKENPRPTREEIRGALAGNICRCSGYVAIVDAISAAAEASR
ncbi:Nicotinate dehydrogenase small FeS subunit [compost metagenome]